ncbi:hypothetical protein GCM10020367_27840 [Streptomyces sannanensis]|uniref:DUF3592 domain-containing protein n=1 Tax=Streptomyces sannanensis TaxID=285536 RepID=A0ABP6SB08_9ACTN
MTKNAVLLDRSGIRLMIPLMAVETVRVSGAKQRTAEIVLTSGSAEADATAVYAIRSSSAEAVTAFAHAVNSAIPERDEAERCFDGAVLVRTSATPLVVKERLWSPRERAVAGVFAGVFVLGLVLPGLRRDGELMTVWAACFAAFLAGCAVAYSTWNALVVWWILRRRGITVVGTYEDFEYGSTDASPGTRVYAFTDVTGAAHKFRGDGRIVSHEPDRIEITYDPARPERAIGRKDPWVKTLHLLAWLFLGVPVTIATAAYLLIYFSAALFGA